MKKIFMTAVLAAICGMANAQSDPDRKVLSEQVYYGSEASNNSNNPCKAPLRTICGKFVIYSETGANGETEIIGEMTDRFGFPIFRKKIIPEHIESIYPSNPGQDDSEGSDD